VPVLSLCYLCSTDIELRAFSRGFLSADRGFSTSFSPVRPYADTPIPSPFVVAAMPRCDLSFKSLLFKICVRTKIRQFRQRIRQFGQKAGAVSKFMMSDGPTSKGLECICHCLLERQGHNRAVVAVCLRTMGQGTRGINKIRTPNRFSPKDNNRIGKTTARMRSRSRCNRSSFRALAR
jgi:hypothetical protein